MPFKNLTHKIIVEHIDANRDKRSLAKNIAQENVDRILNRFGAVKGVRQS